MLLRGANAVGYENYPDNVIEKFCELSVKNGMDVFRVFDSLNYVPNMIVGINAVGNAGGVIEAALAYTGDVSDKKSERYNLDYYMKLTDELVKAGIHVLCIKDMAGVLKPQAARILVGAIRQKYPELPIHVHTHDTAGTGVATMLECAKAGADAVDAAVDSMSGMTSQPSLGAIACAVAGSKFDTGLDLEAISKYSTYWEMTRQLYAPFECTATMRSGNADVHNHQIPGGQYTNLQFQSYALGLGSQFDEVKERYKDANIALGDISKVTPSSKVVGDLAQFMVQQKLTLESMYEKAAELSFPQSVVDFFNGKLGQPPYGFPEEFRNNVLRGKKPMYEGRPGEGMKPVDLEKMRTDLEIKHNQDMTEEDAMSSAMFPAVFDSFVDFRKTYGPVDKMPTRSFLVGLQPTETVEVEIEKGKTLVVKYLSKVDRVNEKGERKVVFELNGQSRNLLIKDKEASKNIVTRPRADPNNKGSVGAPMSGEILELKVQPGDKVKANQTLFVLHAMKMEMPVAAPCDGVVKQVHAAAKEKMESGDLVVEIDSL
uniref:Pyruvate carboxylase, mitochondrial n=1 Tax=Steinernema glaseri TaxID=37863 RepID=A0A1I7YSD5_9BILA